MLEIKTFINDTCEYVNNYLISNNIHDVIIGISGGIDSAVSLAILTQIKNLNIHAYFIDIHSSQSSFEDAQNICNFLNVELNKTSLEKSFEVLVEEFGSTLLVQKTNLKARMRMMFLYHQAMLYHGIVVGNSNADELYLGYYTKFADNAVDMMLLNNLSKKEIIAIAKYFNLPSQIITKAPSADLYEGQTDEQEFGFSYDNLDSFFNTKDMLDKDIKKEIENFHEKNLHKSKVITNPYFLSSKKGFYE